MRALTPSRTAAAIYLAAVVVMGIRAGEPGRPWWWLAMIPFAIWIASPVFGGLWFLRRIRNGRARALFAMLLALVAVAGLALEWHTMFIGPADAQNPLILVFVPLYQWVGVFVALALTWLATRAAAWDATSEAGR